MKKIKENERGITLIALVITIIILLILAGVSIMMLTGENGIITRADEAKTKTEISNLKEQAEIIREGIVTGNRAEGKETTREEIIEGILEEMGGEAEGNLIKTEDGKNEIIVKEDGEIEVVEKGEGYTDAEYKEPAPESDFRWTTLEDGTVRIYEYLGTETSLHIPDTIDGKVVTVLKSDRKTSSSSGSSTEGGNIARKLKDVKIPDTVTTIGYRAFERFEIETLKLPKNLTIIEDFAFADNKIKSIEIPEGVTFIGERAFMDNQATKIEIPSTVTTMEEGAFVRNNVEEIIYGRTSTGEEDKTVINSYAGKNAGNVVIPDGVKKIESWAYYDVGITSLEISESVKTIGLYSFNGKNIKRLVIYAQPEAVHMFRN